MFVPEAVNNKLWHIPFNRVDDDLILDMVCSNADAYYRYEYTIQGGETTLPDSAINYYVGLYTRSRDALRTSFGLYRDWDATLDPEPGCAPEHQADHPRPRDRRRGQLGRPGRPRDEARPQPT